MLNMQIQYRWTEKLTFSFYPKKSRVFLPHTEPLAFEKPGTGVDLTLIARFIPILGAVRCGQPRVNILRWVNWTNYYQFIEKCNSKAPSLLSIIAFIIRPMPTTNKLEKRYQQTRKHAPVCCMPPLISFTWRFVSTPSLVLKRSFREAQPLWHVSIRDFKPPVLILIVRSVKYIRLDLKLNRLKEQITWHGQFRIFMNERRNP